MRSRSPTCSQPHRAEPEGVRRHARDEHLHVLHVDPEQVAERAHLEEPARTQDRHPVAQRLGVGEDVRREEDGLPRLAQAEDDVPDEPPADRVEAGHRLVEDDQLGVVDQGLREPGPLHHPLGEAAERGVRGPLQPHERQERPGPLAADGCSQAEEPARVVEVLGRREVVVEVGVLREVSRAEAPGPRRERLAQHAGFSPVGLQEADEQLEGRGLAGAVRADVPEDLVRPDLEIEVLQGGPPPLDDVAGPVALAQPPRHYGDRLRTYGEI